MWFWWFILGCDCLYALAMIFGGYYMRKLSTGKPNHLAGYRTRRSKMSPEAWQFANEHCGKRWQKIGWILLVPTILVHIPFYGKSDDAIGFLSLAIAVVECAIMLLSILPTQKALKEKFPEE